jgi:DNA-binding Xre family transcriptional regulator
MRLAAGISTSTLAKLNRGEEVNTAILVKICNALNCGLEDIVEYHPEGMAVADLPQKGCHEGHK